MHNIIIITTTTTTTTSSSSSSSSSSRRRSHTRECLHDAPSDALFAEREIFALDSRHRPGRCHRPVLHFVVSATVETQKHAMHKVHRFQASVRHLIGEETESREGSLGAFHPAIKTLYDPVSYTHLTLPTILRV